MKAWHLILGALLGAALAASVAGHAAAPRADAMVEAAPIRAAAALLPAAGEARVLVLGELHGTQEVPALAGEVVRRRIDARVPTTLALEIHVAEQSRIDASPGRSFVVLVGNYHARKAAPTRISSGLPPGGTPPVPTMAHLADLPMLRVNVSAASGTFWACMAGGCGPQTAGGERVGRAGEPRLHLTPGHPHPWDAKLALPSLSAAPPAAGGP